MSFAAPPGPVVVDASVAVELALEGSASIASVWNDWIEQDRLILAPTLVWFEVANALLKGKGLPASSVSVRLEGLEAAGLETTDRGAAGVRAAADLAARHRLTIYDAAYLWLAIDLDGELATLDGALRRAAAAEGIGLAPL